MRRAAERGYLQEEERGGESWGGRVVKEMRRSRIWGWGGGGARRSAQMCRRAPGETVIRAQTAPPLTRGEGS